VSDLWFLLCFCWGWGMKMGGSSRKRQDRAVPLMVSSSSLLTLPVLELEQDRGEGKVLWA
jgi:hypothetical protein